MIEPITIRWDGEVGSRADVYGIDPSIRTVVAYDECSGVIVLHCGGHTVWSGIGVPREYAPAEFEVYGGVKELPRRGGKREWTLTHGVIAFPSRTPRAKRKDEDEDA